MHADAPFGGGSKLASQKYFTPKDLNDLTRVGKDPPPGLQKDPASRKQATKATVVSTGPARTLV